MKNYIVLFVLILVAATLPARADMTSSGAAIKMITRETLRLSDLFSALPQGQDQIIGRAPHPGQDLTLTSTDLSRVAQAYGVSYTPSSSLTSGVILRREGVLLSADRVKDLVLSNLRGKGVSNDADMEVTFNPPFNGLGVSAKSAAKIAIQTINYDPSTGLFDARLNTPSAPMISGRIDSLVNVPIARSTLDKGTLLNGAVLEMVKMKQSQIGKDRVLSLTELEGMAARRTIPAGRPVLARDTEYPINVHRGDKVTIIYRTGIMELSAQGRALQDGRTGDRVNIANTDSNKNIQGTVVAMGQVVID